MSLFIISIFVISVIFFFLLSALILFWLSKLFKIKNATYKNSIMILLFCGIVNFLAGGCLWVLNMEAIVNSSFSLVLIIELAMFLVFHYFFKRYYQNSWKKSLGIYVTFFLLTIIFSLVITIPIRSFLVEPLIMRGNSMSPTLIEGDYLLVEKFDHNYQRGDVVAFYSNSKKGILIRRIVGLSEEKIEIANGNILIDNEILDELKYYNGRVLGDVSLKLNTDEYFVIGDNRETDLDLPVFDLINKKDIIGKVLYKN